MLAVKTFNGECEPFCIILGNQPSTVTLYKLAMKARLGNRFSHMLANYQQKAGITHSKNRFYFTGLSTGAKDKIQIRQTETG